jgi:hypothetical protein
MLNLLPFIIINLRYNKFKIYYAYNLNIFIINNYAKTRLYKLYFYKCKAISYCLVFKIEFNKAIIA